MNTDIYCLLTINYQLSTVNYQLSTVNYQLSTINCYMFNLIEKIALRTPLGWLQLSREKTRFLVALSGIAFADILIFMQLGFEGALYDSNSRLHRSLNADVILISPQGRNLVSISTFSRRRIYQALDVPGVKSTEALYTNFADWKNPETRKKTSILIVGTNPDRQAFNLPGVNANLEKIKLPDTVVFDRATRGEYTETIAALEAGKTPTTEIERRTITLHGLFEIGASFATDGTLITSQENFLRLFPRRQTGAISIGLVELEAGADPTQVTAALNAHLPEDVRALTLEEFINFEKDYWATNTSIGFVFRLGTMMGFIVGVILVYQVLSTDVNDHMAEYATFKAMGYRDWYLLGIVFEEAIILALVGFIPGFSISFGLYSMTRKATNLPIYLTMARVIFVLALTAIMCSLSGAIATRRLQAADPADIF